MSESEISKFRSNSILVTELEMKFITIVTTNARLMLRIHWGRKSNSNLSIAMVCMFLDAYNKAKRLLDPILRNSHLHLLASQSFNIFICIHLHVLFSHQQVLPWFLLSMGHTSKTYWSKLKFWRYWFKNSYFSQN